MENLHSRHKIGSLLLVLITSVLSTGLTLLLLFPVAKDIMSGEWSGNNIIIFLILFLVFVTSLALRILMVDARYVIVNEEYILFINPILPFIRKKVYWKYYNCYYHVKERSQYDEYKAIWLTKDGKVKDRISSFYYKNYSKMKAVAARNVSSKGVLRMDSFTQAACIYLGRKLPDAEDWD